MVIYFLSLNRKHNELPHEISNNVVCATSKASDQPAHTRNLIKAFASRLNILCHFIMSVMLLTEHHFEFPSLKGGCTGSSESIHVKMSHCWKSHVTAQLCCGAHWKHLNETLLVSEYPHHMFC